MGTMSTTTKSKAALVAALVLSMAMPPALAAPAPGRHRPASNASQANHANHHNHARHASPARSHGRDSGSGLGLLLGALVVGAVIIAANSDAREPEVAAPQPYYPPAPPVAAAPAGPPQDYWYFCREANAYYPYVQQCAGGWQQVVPQPPTPGSTPQR